MQAIGLHTTETMADWEYHVPPLPSLGDAPDPLGPPAPPQGAIARIPARTADIARLPR